MKDLRRIARSIAIALLALPLGLIVLAVFLLSVILLLPIAIFGSAISALSDWRLRSSSIGSRLGAIEAANAVNAKYIARQEKVLHQLEEKTANQEKCIRRLEANLMLSPIFKPKPRP